LKEEGRSFAKLGRQVQGNWDVKFELYARMPDVWVIDITLQGWCFDCDTSVWTPCRTTDTVWLFVVK